METTLSRWFGAALVSSALFGLIGVLPALASTTATLLPNGEGNYLQFTPSTGTTHYTLVDESSCNGTTDYNFTTTVGNRDSYAVSLSSIANGSTVTNIDIVPCASRNASGGTNPVMNLFYRWGGANSSDSGSYSLTGTTPTALATTSFSGLSFVKGAGSTLELGSVLTSGAKGVRLSRIATMITYTLLSAPTGLSGVASTTTSIQLSWTDNATNEDGYVVEHKLSTDPTWTTVATTSANVNSYEDTGLTTDSTYNHRVRAFNGSGYSAYSNVASTTVGTIPTAPTDVTVTASTTALSMIVNWTDNSSNETSFHLERTATSSGKWTALATTSANAITYTDAAGLLANTAYTYRVRAHNAVGDSAYATSASSTTATIPAAPSGLVGTPLSGSVQLDWVDNASNELFTAIEGKVSATSTWQKLASTTADIMTYVDTTLGTTTGTYNYRVRAWNSVGYSVFSNIATTTVP